MNRDDILLKINEKHSKWQHNNNEDSFYTECNNHTLSTNERCSFHYPVFETWLTTAIERINNKLTKYNPLDGQNIAFTFHDSQTIGSPDVRVKFGTIDTLQKMFKTDSTFKVKLFDWNLEELTQEEVDMIFNAINESFITHDFQDPLFGTPHSAKTQELGSIIIYHQNPCQTTGEQQITTENKKYKNMKKQTIRLNENQLRKLIKETIKKVLNII